MQLLKSVITKNMTKLTYLSFAISLFAGPAFASDLVINDCSGKLLAMREVDSQAGLSFNVKPTSAEVSSVKLESLTTDSNTVQYIS